MAGESPDDVFDKIPAAPSKASADDVFNSLGTSAPPDAEARTHYAPGTEPHHGFQNPDELDENGQPKIHDIKEEMLEDQRKIAGPVEGLAPVVYGGAGALGLSGVGGGVANVLQGKDYEEGRRVGEAKEQVAKHDSPVRYAVGQLGTMFGALRGAGPGTGALVGGARGAMHGNPVEAVQGAVVGGTLGGLAKGVPATFLTRAIPASPRTAAALGTGLAGYGVAKADNPGDKLTALAAGLGGVGSAGYAEFGKWLGKGLPQRQALAEEQVLSGERTKFADEQKKIGEDYTKGLDDATDASLRAAKIARGPQEVAVGEAHRVNSETDRVIAAQRAAHGEAVAKADAKGNLNAREALLNNRNARAQRQAENTAEFQRAKAGWEGAKGALNAHGDAEGAANNAVKEFAKNRLAVTSEQGRQERVFASETDKIQSQIEALQAADKKLDDSGRAAWAKLHADLAVRLDSLVSAAKNQKKDLGDLKPRITAMQKYLVDTHETWTGPKLTEMESGKTLGQDKWLEKRNADAKVANQNERGALHEQLDTRTAPTRADAEKAVADRSAPTPIVPDDAAAIAAFAEQHGLDASDLRAAIAGKASLKTPAPAVPAKPTKVALPFDAEAAKIRQGQIDAGRARLDRPDFQPTNVSSIAADQERLDFPGFREGPAASMQPQALKYAPPEPPPTFTPEQQAGLEQMRAQQTTTKAGQNIRSQYASQGVENPNIAGRYIAGNVPLLSRAARAAAHLIHAAGGKKSIEPLSSRVAAGEGGFSNPAEAAAVLGEVAPAMQKSFPPSRGGAGGARAGTTSLEAMFSDPEERERFRQWLDAQSRKKAGAVGRPR